MKKAFIFDLDGTILDSMPHWRSENRVVLDYYNYKPDTETEAQLPITVSFKVASLIESAGIASTADVLAKYHEDMLTRYLTVVQPKKGILEFLTLLKEKGVRLFVASATYRHIVKKALDKQNILDFFEDIFDDTTFGIPKSNPDYFIRLCKQINEVPSDCVMFEDSLYAIMSAASSGLEVWAINDTVANSIPGNKEKIESSCNVYVNDFYEALDRFVKN